MYTNFEIIQPGIIPQLLPGEVQAAGNKGLLHMHTFATKENNTSTNQTSWTNTYVLLVSIKLLWIRQLYKMSAIRQWTRQFQNVTKLK